MKATSTIDEKLKTYKLVKTLGKGTFGTTYLYHKNSKSPKSPKNSKSPKNQQSTVVVKEIKVNSPNDLRLYGIETKVLNMMKQGCQSKHILCPNAIYQKPNYVHFTTEFIDGMTLTKALEEIRNLKDPQQQLDITLRLLSQLMIAVKTIHQRGVIHSDIKPDNIMVKSKGKNKFGNLILIDFGLATLNEGPKNQEVVINGGSKYYMPPFLVKKVFKQKETAWVGFEEACGLDVFGAVKSFYDKKLNLGFAYIFKHLKFDRDVYLKNMLETALRNEPMSSTIYKKLVNELSKF